MLPFLSGHRLILGSNSPRRRDILKSLDLDFEVDANTCFKESINIGEDPSLLPETMSKGKSHGFHRPLREGEILITADTLVLLPDRILGKPSSREDAASMLRALSGRTHRVITAVTLRSTAKELTFSEVTEVTFKELEEDEINYYIDTYKPFDKAGAYGVQEWIGCVGIEKLDGSFYNVVGFPVQRFWKELRKFI